MTERKRWRAVLLAAMVWLVAACGPGVGGTGTGNGVALPGVTGLTYFGAQQAPVCQSDFGDLLGCVPATTGAPPALPGAITLVGECAVATFENDDIVLDVLCGGWSFAGRWGLTEDGTSRFYGLAGLDPLLLPGDPASLEVQVRDGALMLWLRSSDGELLAGPLAVRMP